MVNLVEIEEFSSMKKRRLTAKNGVLNEEHSSVGVNYGAEWNVGYQKWCDIRHRVKEILQLFRETLKKVQRENKAKPRIERGCSYTMTSNALKEKRKWLNTSKWFGFVPGVEIGDEFQSKAELRIIGLHHRRFCGIDYLVWKGNLLATSVVVTKRYANKMESADVLVYIGEGGNPQVKNNGPLKDQKLERGNLALKNSIEHKTPVRVICCHEQKGAKCIYVYDGLYLVESFWQDRGEFGKLVFKFQMRKLSGLQNMVPKHVTSESKKIFNHNRKSPICKNKLAEDIRKAPFLATKSKSISGCYCVNGCSELKDCSCKAKNGGKMPYDYDGCLVRKMCVISECGPSCKCPPSCMNRVTQRGTRAKLEFSRYGVRSKSCISKGSFICKFEPRKLFLGNEKPINDVAMDISREPNVGRYINNSSAPNLYGQKVIIGNEDEPHMMLFTMRNILPSEELTIGFKNQVLNSIK